MGREDGRERERKGWEGMESSGFLEGSPAAGFLRNKEFSPGHLLKKWSGLMRLNRGGDIEMTIFGVQSLD